jgi:hypothetical protein
MNAARVSAQRHRGETMPARPPVLVIRTAPVSVGLGPYDDKRAA